MNFNEEDFYNCENLEAITEGAITSRQRGSDLHQVRFTNENLNTGHVELVNGEQWCKARAGLWAMVVAGPQNGAMV